MEQYLIEMTVYDPALPGVKTLYYSTHGYTSPPGATPANTYYAPRILEPGNFEISMFGPARTSGQSTIGFGEVRLVNPDGELDNLIDYGIDGRTIVFKQLTALGAVLLLASCAMEQPEFGDDAVTVRIKDFQALLNTALQPTKYAGTNVLPAGIEGTEDIKGKPKPLAFGKVYNVTPVLVNTSRLIYQVHTGAVAVPAVYDKGVGLAKGADYTSQVEMESAAPLPGQYRVWPGGGCFRLGASPAGEITCDAVEGATAADRTAAQVAKRLALRVLSSDDIDAADVSALSADNSAEVGIYLDQETTVTAAEDQVLGSVGAWYGFDAQGKLRMARFTEPAGPEAFTLTADQILSLERIASGDPGRGVPAYKVNLSYGKNYTVQTSDLAGSVQTAREAAFWSRGSVPVGGNWTGLAYGNGMYVAVAGLISTNLAVSSPDGFTWTARTLPATVNWQGVAYGNGLFVAIAYGSTSYATSADGVTWTLRTFPTVGCLEIAFDGGLFLAPVYNSNTLYTSPDGVTWTARTLPAVGNWVNVARGNGIFVAITNNSNLAATSPDGVTWTARTLPAVDDWRGLAFGNGVFVTTAYQGNKFATSQDGISWTAGTLPASVGNGIAYGKGMFIAIGIGVSLVSADGYNWLLQSTPSSYYDVIAYGNGSFIMLDPFYAYKYAISPSSQRVQWLSREYRTVTIADVTVQTVHKLSPELNVSTLLTDYDAATLEAERLLALYKVRRDTLKISVSASVLPFAQTGQIGKIYYHRYGYNSGKLFRVIGVNPEWGTGTVTLTLWG